MARAFVTLREYEDEAPIPPDLVETVLCEVADRASVELGAPLYRVAVHAEVHGTPHGTPAAARAGRAQRERGAPMEP